MSLKEIITVPDPLLRKISEPVERVDKELLTLLDDMLETMYDAPGIGLAAIQVAVPRRVLVMDIARKEEPKKPFCLINPKIVRVSQEMSIHDEGCLSIPEHYAEVERPASVTVSYIDRDGNEQERDFNELLSRVVQHEIDHLDGKQFIDYISKLKRDRIVRKLKKEARRANSVIL
ncbi:MAG: peptide deformylase [Hyphomicrobiaceae bacterium]|nr:peptide deformylase [Hyphomicrobiaceae bacterium]